MSWALQQQKPKQNAKTRHKVLLLYADGTPKALLRWDEAFGLTQYGRADVIVVYQNLYLQSPQQRFAYPAVIMLKRDYLKPNIAPSRYNIYCRDRFTCQYCGFNPKSNKNTRTTNHLTIDHVVPLTESFKGKVYSPFYRKQVKTEGWQNKVTCCHWCNRAKDHQSLRESGLTLDRYPYEPDENEKRSLMFHAITKLPNEWLPFVS